MNSILFHHEMASIYDHKTYAFIDLRTVDRLLLFNLNTVESTTVSCIFSTNVRLLLDR